MTTEATLVSKKGYPTEFRVQAPQLKDCEMLQRAGLGMTNHLDWFISTIWRVLDQAQLAEETKAELDGLLTSCLVSVNQTAHVFARLLASNATCREGIFDLSVLDRASEVVMRVQPIGGANLMGGRCAEFVQGASEETQKSLLFQAAMGRSEQPKGTGMSRGSFKIHYSQDCFVQDGWEQYLNGLRDGEWGDQLALIGIANAFDVAVSIMSSLHVDTGIQYTHPHNNGTEQRCISLGHEFETQYIRLDRRMHQSGVQASS